MPDFSRRSDGVEIMDDLEYAGPLMVQTLYELEIINRWLGGNAVTIGALGKILENHNETSPITIADLGCGRGDMLLLIDTWARKKNRKVRLIGIDANPYIISVAKANLKGLPNIEFQSVNIFSPEFESQKFDVVIGTLFYHHFTAEQLVSFFSTLRKQVTMGVVINDIHRHPLAFYSIKLLTRLFSKSSMVKFDAPLSVLRAFRKQELREILLKAGITDLSIRWRWAFRWQVVGKFL